MFHYLCIKALSLVVFKVLVLMDFRCGGWGLTNAGDLLWHQVLQEGIDDRIVSGVQLVSINPNVEAEPVGVGLSHQLSCRAELIHGALPSPGEEENLGGENVINNLYMNCHRTHHVWDKWKSFGVIFSLIRTQFDVRKCCFLKRNNFNF